MSGTTEDIQITTSGGETMGAYLALPESGEPAPAVIVWMEIFGVNDHIRDVTRRVAAEGYVALAPDFFHRTGPGLSLGYDDDGFAEGFKHLGALKVDQMVADAKDAVGFLKSRRDVVSDKLGAMGFCIGGHMTYLTACETDIRAAASYYGGGIAAAEGPGGGSGTLTRTGKISGNFFVQGRDKENYSTFIAIAAEDRTHDSTGLVIADNIAAIAPGVTRSTIFIANWSTDKLAIGDNRLGDGLTLYEKR